MPSCAPGSDLVLLAASIAIAISGGLSAEETNILGTLFNAVGDNLAIIATKKAICQGAD